MSGEYSVSRDTARALIASNKNIRILYEQLIAARNTAKISRVDIQPRFGLHQDTKNDDALSRYEPVEAYVLEVLEQLVHTIGLETKRSPQIGLSSSNEVKPLGRTKAHLRSDLSADDVDLKASTKPHSRTYQKSKPFGRISPEDKVFAVTEDPEESAEAEWQKQWRVLLIGTDGDDNEETQRCPRLLAQEAAPQPPTTAPVSPDSERNFNADTIRRTFPRRKGRSS